MLVRWVLILAGDLKHGKEATVFFKGAMKEFFNKCKLKLAIFYTCKRFRVMFVLRELNQVTFKGFVERVGSHMLI